MDRPFPLSPKQKSVLRSAIGFVLLMRFLYVASFPLNFGGDASVYYTMIVEKHSNLLMAAGYPFLMLLPYHWMKEGLSRFWDVPKDLSFTPWWQSSALRGDLVGSRCLSDEFSWVSWFQDHGFILLQHSLSLAALFCAFALIRRHFGFSISFLFLLLFGCSPLSLEWPSSCLPEWLQGAFLIFWVYLADWIRSASFPRKLLGYGALGVLAAFGFLIKYNSLPVYALFFLGLLAIDKEQVFRAGKAFFKTTASAAGAFCALFLFIAVYHLPTTGTVSLSMNKWPLADKVFQYLPVPSLPPELGIHAKRLLAIHADLPKDNPDVLSPAKYFRNVHLSAEAKKPYREKYSWLMTAEEKQLDAYLLSHGYDPIYAQPSALRVAYYIGLEEYSSLLKGIYKEGLRCHPLEFFQDTANNFFSDFSMRENSYVFRPQYDEVIAGRSPDLSNQWGYVPFLWPRERYVCYHENAVWLPGAWLFTKWQSLYPSTRCFWFFSFIAFLIAANSFQSRKSRGKDGVVIFLFLTAVLFVWLSNMIWIFRLKEYEFIRSIPTFLAAVGFCQSLVLVQSFLRKYRFRRKLDACLAGKGEL